MEPVRGRLGRVGLDPLLLAGVLAGATGCPTAEEWRNADLQLDVRADLPEDAARVRICVAGTGSRTQGAGPDAYAVPGIPTDRPAVVTVDVLAPSGDAEDTGSGEDRVLARAGPIALDAATPWREAPLEVFGEADGACPACPEACAPTGAFAPAEAASWLLAVRFRP